MIKYSPNIGEYNGERNVFEGNIIFTEADFFNRNLHKDLDIALDLETTGLNIWKDKVAWLILYGNNSKELAVIHVDKNHGLSDHFKRWLSNPLRFYTAHNSTMFDWQWLRRMGMLMSKVVNGLIH